MILVLRALKLGDLLTAVPALRSVRAAFPDEEIVLAAPAWLAPLVHHIGAVDRLVDSAPLAPLHPAVHGARLAVNLHGRGPKSTNVLRATSPARLLSFDAAGGPAWHEDDHERERWCRLLRHAGIRADPDDYRLEVPAAEPPAVAVGATVIHPGASTESRRWPAERWADVARHAAGAGRPVVVTGDESEVALAHQVATTAGLDPECVLAGRTGLLDLLAVVGAAAQVVCGDTGTAHVATALGTPSVVLFGPTSPASWGPPAGGPHTVLWAGRTGDPAADRADPGLLEIQVADVVDALHRLPVSA